MSWLSAKSSVEGSVAVNGVTKSYTATVNAAGTGWSATIPSTDALALANGTATVSAQVTDANGNSSAIATQSVTVAETGRSEERRVGKGCGARRSAEASAAGERARCSTTERAGA